MFPCQVNDTDELEVIWSDGHVSKFTSDWLKRRSFNETNRISEGLSLRRPERLWTANQMKGKIPRVNFKEVCAMVFHVHLRNMTSDVI